MIINNEIGDLKECSSLTAVDKRLRKAIHQECRYAALNVTAENITLADVKQVCQNRLKNSANDIKQILIFLNGVFYKL